MAPLRNAVLIAGPTASGKSAMAIDVARKTGGVIVNADSMQVYDVLRVLTARPNDADLAAADHALYGHVDPRDHYSTGRWLREVETLAQSGRFEGGPAILVGGTGLYFEAALRGLSAMPEIPDAVRAAWRRRLAAQGASNLHSLLAEHDPRAANSIRSTDGQRIVRALEVLEASGKPISEWQAEPGKPLVDASTARLMVLQPDRTELAARIARRFEGMIGAGALDEVSQLAALDLDPALPAAKAIGVRELSQAIDGQISLERAIDLATIATRQYAKRQSTWFRNRFGPQWRRLAPGDPV